MADLFDRFAPLMAHTEQRLGRKPRFGTWDAAYDAHYVYDYFHRAGGFAAVPFNPGGPQRARRAFRKRSTTRCWGHSAVLCATSSPSKISFWA